MSIPKGLAAASLVILALASTVRAQTLTAINLTPNSVVAGSSAAATVNIMSAAGMPVTVSLTNSDPTVATFPPNVIIAMGQTNAPFVVTALKPGAITITAALGAMHVMSTLTVTAPNPSTTDVLQNLGFGLALSLRWNILKPDVVNDAVVDASGVVRVNTRSNTTAGFMLEMHYFPDALRKGNFGTGPFVAAQPGTEQIIEAIGAGWMIGWKISEAHRNGFGLGVGYAAQPSAKTLGDEFVNGQPAPLGPDGKTPLPIRFETRDKGSVLMITSFTF